MGLGMEKSMQHMMCGMHFAMLVYPLNIVLNQECGLPSFSLSRDP